MILGRVMSVSEDTAVTDLGVDASAAATSITINDPSVLNEDGGSLIIRDDVNTETRTYTSVNMDTGVVSGVQALANAYVAGTAVVQSLSSVSQRYAEVLIDSTDDEIDSTSVVAKVPNVFFDRLPLGVRDVNSGERIFMDFTDGDLIVRDFPGETPVVDGSYITPSTLPPVSSTDGLAPTVSPTPTVRPGVEFLAIEWDPISNPDLVTYEVHISSSSAVFTPGPTTLYGEIAGTILFIQKLPDGSALVVGTTYYVRMIAKDKDGSAPAGTAGSGSVIRMPSSSNTSDGAAPASSPTPTVLGGIGILSVKWTPITNNDPVTYDVHLSTTTGFTPSGTTPGTGTCIGSTAAGSFVINSTVAGGALVYGTTYYVKIVARDPDGSATASAQATGSLVQVGTIDISTISSAEIVSDGAAPASSPTPTVIGGPGYLNATWVPISNTDAVRYEVHLSTTTGFTPSGTTPGTGTCYAITPGSQIVINSTVAGAALAYATPYFVKIVARDNDGAAAASAQGTASLVRVNTGQVGTDAVAPASSPTPTVKGGPTFVSAEWAPVANADPVQYEVHLSTTTGFTPSGTTAGTGTCYAVTTATSIVIKTTVAGAALAYGTTYFVKLVAKDADGSAAAGAQGSASMVQIISGDVGTDTITAGNIAAGAITSSELASNSVIAGKIAAGTIVAADISAGSITGDRLTADTITATQIAANAITSSELNAGAVTAGKIAAGTIVAADIAAGTITGDRLVAGTITATQIATDTITATQIAANAITTSELNALAVTAAKIAANTITAAQIAADTLTATEIAANAITASELAANSVVAGDITANAVTAGTIAANAVTATEIAANAITAAKILAGSVTAAKLEASLVMGTTIQTAASGQRVVLTGDSLLYGDIGFFLVRTNAEGYDESVASITTIGGAAFGQLTVGTLISDDVVSFNNEAVTTLFVDASMADDSGDGSYPKIKLADDFNRTVTGAFWTGASDGRHLWTHPDGVASQWSMVPGTPGLAKASINASNQRAAIADSGTIFEEQRVNIQMDKNPAGGLITPGVLFRAFLRNGTSFATNGTGFRVEFVNNAGAVVPQLRIAKVIDGVTTILAGPTALPDGLVQAINSNWTIRAQCYSLPNGSTRIRAYAWKSTGVEPTSWLLSVDSTDSANDMRSGGTGLWTSTGAGISNAPIVTTWSSWTYTILDPKLLWADDSDATPGTYTYAPAGGTPFQTLERALREVDRYNQGSVFICYEWGGDLPYWPHTILDGFVGAGRLVITTGAMSFGVGVVTGTIAIQGCSHFIRLTGCIVTDDNGAQDDVVNATILVNVSRHVEVSSCILQGNSNPLYNVAYFQGSEGNVYGCQLNGATSATLRAAEASLVRAEDNRGAATNAYSCQSSIIFKTGTWPTGGGSTAAAGIIGTGGGVGPLIDAATTPAGDNTGQQGPTSSKKTKTWAASGGATYGLSFNTWSGGDVTQGQYGGSQNHKGAWRMPGGVASTLGGKTIDSVFVTITRASYGGASGAVSLFLVTYNQNVLSGAGNPGVIDGPNNIGSLAWGQTKTFKVPNGFADTLKAGGRMLGLYVSGGSPYLIAKSNLKLKVTYH